MKFAKLTFSMTIEIVMQVPDETPTGDMPDANSASMMEALKEQFKGDPSTRLVSSEVKSAVVVEV